VRILIVGAGATGGYFGARLAAAGRDVTFLVRRARAAALSSRGLQIIGPSGETRITPQLVLAGDVRPDYDAIILAVKAYALDAALGDVAPAVGQDTMIVPFLNGLRHIDALVARFGEAPVLGGVCLVATQLDDAGRIVQLNDMQEVVYGERDGSASARVAALDAAMQGAGFAARSSQRINADMWDKWVGLAALGAMTCLARGTTGEIEAQPGGADFARAIIDECAATATAAGFAPTSAYLTRIRTMATAPGSPLATSMFRDMQQGRAVEVDQILGDLVARARSFGVAVPLLTAAFISLRVHDARVAHAAAADASAPATARA
jgi:2-dehydropantoate 2-reductase